MDFSIFATAEAWISLVTLLFLEIILGVDNIVFISLTSNRLPPEKQHIGRKLGLAGAMIMRIGFLSLASFLVHLVNPLFTVDLGFFQRGFSVRDIILMAGGIYLIYKGVSELKATVQLKELVEEKETGKVGGKRIGLPQAVGTIMVMDIVFSIDSVITAVGLADHLIIMIIAVISAIIIMMMFIDPISEFIDRNAEMKILAVTFISMIGILLVLDSLGINSGIEVLDMHMEKVMVYFAMLFAVILEMIQIRYKNNLKRWNEAQLEEEGGED
ncbi:MAG TPA: TerC family protein [Eggerthellaceae bacterium]|nr:TerC family protein [Eggerthellaceae bacterium]